MAVPQRSRCIAFVAGNLRGLGCLSNTAVISSTLLPIDHPFEPVYIKARASFPIVYISLSPFVTSVYLISRAMRMHLQYLFDTYITTLGWKRKLTLFLFLVNPRSWREATLTQIRSVEHRRSLLQLHYMTDNPSPLFGRLCLFRFITNPIFTSQALAFSTLISQGSRTQNVSSQKLMKRPSLAATSKSQFGSTQLSSRIHCQSPAAPSAIPPDSSQSQSKSHS